MAKTYTIQKQAVIDNRVTVAMSVQKVGLPNKRAAVLSCGARNPRLCEHLHGMDIWTDDDGWTYLVIVGKEN
jgi:hypothetical protein